MPSKAVQQKTKRAFTPVPVELTPPEIKHLLKLHLASWKDDPLQSTNSFTYLAMKLQAAYNQMADKPAAASAE